MEYAYANLEQTYDNVKVYTVIDTQLIAEQLVNIISREQMIEVLNIRDKHEEGVNLFFKYGSLVANLSFNADNTILLSFVQFESMDNALDYYNLKKAKGWSSDHLNMAVNHYNQICNANTPKTTVLLKD